ncbi:hypothetical protein PsYK624_098890 [Phanerochaete sordida]|uniref:Uncharacterized protein n=1 Tax=Phanerochaete sordida TaxID=48140 RepID=A0A9P3GF28_9APHY|nr:hypothetical protein PsYK624_098890 [Phanerochaete sordida]
MLHADSAPWSLIGAIMGRPIAAAVRAVAFDVTLFHRIAPDAPASDADARGLEQAFRHALDAWDWAPLAAVVGRLQSLAVNVELRLLQSNTATLGVRHIYSAWPRTWAGDPKAYRAILLSVVRDRLSMTARQRLDLCVTFLPVPAVAMN